MAVIRTGMCKNCWTGISESSIGIVSHDDRGFLRCFNVKGNSTLNRALRAEFSEPFGTGIPLSNLAKFKASQLLCKHCSLPIKDAPADKHNKWIHTSGWYGCSYANGSTHESFVKYDQLQATSVGEGETEPTPFLVPKHVPTMVNLPKPFIVAMPAYTGPVCRYCKEPIQPHQGGMYHGHWEHMVLQPQYGDDGPWAGFDTKHSNRWSCCTPKTNGTTFRVADSVYDPNAKKKTYADTANSTKLATLEPINTFMTTLPVTAPVFVTKTTTVYLAQTYTKRKFKKG